MIKKFKYTLISDMHIEHPHPKTPYDKFEENIIVAGDTSNGLLGLKFLQKLRNKGHTVYACTGNHEHYSNVSQGRTHVETEKRFQEEYPMFVDVDDTLTLININGWYPVESPQIWFKSMNDCRYAFSSDANQGYKEANELCTFHANLVFDMIDSFPERKFIVTTHTAPCEETLNPEYKGSYSNLWYWNPFMRDVLKRHSKQILAWNHGHTHARNEAIVDGVKVVCNPRGYTNENPEWEPLTVEIEYDDEGRVRVS